MQSRPTMEAVQLSFYVLLAVVVCGGIEVKLSRRSTIYIPYEYSNGTPLYSLEEVAVEQTTYDHTEKILYGVGDTILHAVDVSNADNMTIETYLEYQNVEFTDVEYCGGYVFAAYDNLGNRGDGRVVVFSAYNGTEGSMQELMQISVGAVPDMVKPTSDCSKVVVAVEGEAYESPANQITDPPGKITIITFPNGVNTDYNVVALDFERYNDRVAELSESGVRHVYRENNNPFSNDVEPEYVTFNHDDTKAYVVLQENNAIAEVDLVRQNITGIHGLGYKNWSMYHIDPSDQDRGSLMYPYHIMGIYQPDSIAHFRFKGDDYVVTANEGDSKDYRFGTYTWTEETRGASISAAMRPADLDSETVAQLSRDTMLGRMKFATSPAEMEDGRLRALYCYGGRSFTIRRASDMSVVYDSGDDISRQTFLRRHPLFNTHIESADNLPVEDIDHRSDDKGPETESLAVGEVDGNILVFVGNERPGTILVYSIDSDVSKPRFQDIYDGIPDKRSKTWNQLFDERMLSEVDPEDLRFIPASKSPTNKPILFATGSVSGTISIIDVNISDSPSPPDGTDKPCVNSATLTRPGYSVPLFVVMMPALFCTSHL